MSRSQTYVIIQEVIQSVYCTLKLQTHQFISFLDFVYHYGYIGYIVQFFDYVRGG